VIILELEFGILVSFLAGVLSFLSPCVLAIAPAYLGYVSGVETLESDRRKVVLHTFLFVVGFATVFFLMGMGASALGVTLLQYRLWFTRIAGFIIIIFGLHILGVFKIKYLYAEKRIRPGEGLGKARSFLLGITFALGWTPCVGPILGSILLYVSTLGHIIHGGVLLAFYSIGLALPFLFLGAGWTYALGFFRKIQKGGRWVELASGILLVFLGFLLVFDQMHSLLAILGIDMYFSPEMFLAPL